MESDHQAAAVGRSPNLPRTEYAIDVRLVINSIEQICVLVAFAFTAARLHLLQPPSLNTRSLSRRTATFAIMLAMAVVEEVVASQHVRMGPRTVSACAAGLLAGPRIGVGVGLCTALLRQLLGLNPPPAFGVVLAASGLIGGIIHDRRPDVALRGATGFLLGASASLSRYLVVPLFSDRVGPGFPLEIRMEAAAALINGVGVATILKVIEQVRDLEASSRLAAMSEVRALQARMNPHFLFNALNSIAALAAISPRDVPPAVARLGKFLRGSLEQHDRATLPLREELAVVAAYLEIESLRFGDRLRVVSDVADELLAHPVPPFSIQPLAENAVRHGLQPLRGRGTVTVRVRSDGGSMIVQVEDDGVGPGAASTLADGFGPEPHALSLLKRRLEALYGKGRFLQVRPRDGGGTVAELRIPLERDRSGEAS